MQDRAFIDQLADTWWATAELGEVLAAQEWDAPTECPGWSVKDHLSHMVGTELMLLGLPSPPAAAAASHIRNPLGEMNEAWVEERRSRPAPEVLAEWRSAVSRRLDALRAMSSADLSVPTPSPIGQVPYSEFMSVRVMDCWVHEQDMRQATGRPWRLEGPAAPAALQRLDGSFAYVVGKRVAPQEGTRLALEVHGPLARVLAVAVEGGRAVPAEVGIAGERLDARIGVDARTYVRLVTGRLAGDAALEGGLVALEGDRRLGEAVIRSLAVVP